MIPTEWPSASWVTHPALSHSQGQPDSAHNTEVCLTDRTGEEGRMTALFILSLFSPHAFFSATISPQRPGGAQLLPYILRTKNFISVHCNLAMPYFPLACSPNTQSFLIRCLVPPGSAALSLPLVSLVRPVLPSPEGLEIQTSAGQFQDSRRTGKGKGCLYCFSLLCLSSHTVPA